MTPRPALHILVGTAGGLRQFGAQERSHFVGHEITAVARDGHGWWAIVDGRTIRRQDGAWEEVAAVEGGEATCLLPTPTGLFVGTSGAHLLRLSPTGLVPVDSFEAVEGRPEWYTPWGDPPDTRSMAMDAAGTIYVNVHVGGVVRSTDDGVSWRPTLDIESDVHQVLAHPARAGLVLAAAAVGLAVSEDGGETWRIETDGLHATYSRAVAVSGDTVLLSASTGPRTKRAAIYRRRLGERGPLERCRQGLPEWFGANIDTACLAASGATVAVGTDDGVVFLSTDRGETWELLAKDLPAIQCVVLG